MGIEIFPEDSEKILRKDAKKMNTGREGREQEFPAVADNDRGGE